MVSAIVILMIEIGVAPTKLAFAHERPGPDAASTVVKDEKLGGRPRGHLRRDWRFQPEKTFHPGSKEPQLVDVNHQIKERPSETDEEKQRSQEAAGNA